MIPGRMGRIAALLTVVGCTTSLLTGAVGGTGAYFSDSHYGSVQISMANNLVIQVSSDTAGAAISQDGGTLTCPDVLVLTSTGDNGVAGPHGTLTGCDITVQPVGAVAPVHFAVTATVSSSGVDLTRFTLHLADGAAPTAFALAEVPTEAIANWTSVDNSSHTLTSAVSWVGLTNADMNGWIKVTYSIDAHE